MDLRHLTNHSRISSGINVNYNNDKVQLNSAAIPFEFIWVTKTESITFACAIEHVIEKEKN